MKFNHLPDYAKDALCERRLKDSHKLTLTKTEDPEKKQTEFDAIVTTRKTAREVGAETETPPEVSLKLQNGKTPRIETKRKKIGRFSAEVVGPGNATNAEFIAFLEHRRPQ